jgi:hypothetical protein
VSTRRSEGWCLGIVKDSPIYSGSDALDFNNAAKTIFRKVELDQAK